MDSAGVYFVSREDFEARTPASAAVKAEPEPATPPGRPRTRGAFERLRIAAPVLLIAVVAVSFARGKLGALEGFLLGAGLVLIWSGRHRDTLSANR